jgi:hypothetical protein
MGRFATLVLVALLVMAGFAVLGPPAEAISCMNAGNVTALGAAGCDFFGVNYSGFEVSPVGVAANVFLGSFSNDVGQTSNLTFQISHSPSPANLADILFYYTAKAIQAGTAITGVDLFNPGSNVTIRENACGTPFQNGVCTSGLLADLVVTEQSIGVATFLPEGTVYIRKDIQLLESSFISEFTNSHALSEVPEPATMLLLGSSLAAAGMISRRRLLRKQQGNA